jgi:hypothetical protein
LELGFRMLLLSESNKKREMGVKKIRDIELRFFSFLQLKNVCLANRRVDIKQDINVFSISL